MAEANQHHAGVHCDVCDSATRIPGFGEQFGVLQALWGYGSRHDGERYRVRLCEPCFFQVLAYIKQERRIQHLFNEERVDDHDFGRMTREDFWGE